MAEEGIRLFNAGDYFAAHEALEAAWRADAGPVRNLYRGILQVGVGYLHILRGNYTGARKMFRRCRVWLAVFPNHCRTIDVAQLRKDFEAVDSTLARLGPERIGEFDYRLFKPIARAGVAASGRGIPT